jgi:hypothetical protein
MRRQHHGYFVEVHVWGVLDENPGTFFGTYYACWFWKHHDARRWHPEVAGNGQADVVKSGKFE